MPNEQVKRTIWMIAKPGKDCPLILSYDIHKRELHAKNQLQKDLLATLKTAQSFNDVFCSIWSGVQILWRSLSKQKNIGMIWNQLKFNPIRFIVNKSFKHLTKILQHLLQSFYGVFDHFVDSRHYRVSNKDAVEI